MMRLLIARGAGAGWGIAALSCWPLPAARPCCVQLPIDQPPCSPCNRHCECTRQCAQPLIGRTHIPWPPRRARDLWLKGIQALRRSPNAYLYQSLAVLAAEMDCVEEARKWFREGTRTIMVSTTCGARTRLAVRNSTSGRLGAARQPAMHGRYSQQLAPTEGSAHGRARQACSQLYPVHSAGPPPADCSPAWTRCPAPQGRASHALWQAWALMEQKQGDRALVRALFRRGLEARCAPRRRFAPNPAAAPSMCRQGSQGSHAVGAAATAGWAV